MTFPRGLTYSTSVGFLVLVTVLLCKEFFFFVRKPTEEVRNMIIVTDSNDEEKKVYNTCIGIDYRNKKQTG